MKLKKVEKKVRVKKHIGLLDWRGYLGWLVVGFIGGILWTPQEEGSLEVTLPETVQRELSSKKLSFLETEFEKTQGKAYSQRLIHWLGVLEKHQRDLTDLKEALDAVESQDLKSFGLKRFQSRSFVEVAGALALSQSVSQWVDHLTEFGKLQAGESHLKWFQSLEDARQLVELTQTLATAHGLKGHAGALRFIGTSDTIQFAKEIPSGTLIAFVHPKAEESVTHLGYIIQSDKGPLLWHSSEAGFVRADLLVPYLKKATQHRSKIPLEGFGFYSWKEASSS